MRPCKIYSLSNFEIHHAVSLSVVAMPGAVSPGLVYSVTGSLYLLITRFWCETTDSVLVVLSRE